MGNDRITKRLTLGSMWAKLRDLLGIRRINKMSKAGVRELCSDKKGG